MRPRSEGWRDSWTEASRTRHRKPDTIYNGLATGLRKHPEFKGIAVVRRADEVYLRHKK